jgi:hypothetical protein
MHKNAMKCNKTQSKWCKNKHGASKIIDTFETYQAPLQVMLAGGGALDPGQRGSVLLSGNLPLFRAIGSTPYMNIFFHRIFGGVLLRQFLSRLMGGAAGDGGVRGWRLDEVTMLNPSLATCLTVRVCSE